MKRLILGWIGLMMAHSALADCNLSFSATNVTVNWTVSYASQSVTLTLNNNHGSNCSYIVGFTAGGAGGTNFNSRRVSVGSSTLGYQLYGDSGLTHILKDGGSFTSSNDALSGTVGGHSSVTLTYYIQIPVTSQPTNSLPAAGTYLDTFAVNAYTGSIGHPGSAVASSNVSVMVTVPKIVDLSLVSAGGSFVEGQTNYSMNFGTVTSPQTLSMSMLIRANAGYNITFSSNNDGVMASAGLATTLPYSVQVNSSTRNMIGSKGSPVQVAAGSNQTSFAGVSNTVAVTSGSTSASLAGSYSDTITITATSTQ